MPASLVSSLCRDGEARSGYFRNLKKLFSAFGVDGQQFPALQQISIFWVLLVTN
jgi:hypothetical protein